MVLEDATVQEMDVSLEGYYCTETLLGFTHK